MANPHAVSFSLDSRTWDFVHSCLVCITEGLSVWKLIIFSKRLVWLLQTSFLPTLCKLHIFVWKHLWKRGNYQNMGITSKCTGFHFDTILWFYHRKVVLEELKIVHSLYIRTDIVGIVWFGHECLGINSTIITTLLDYSEDFFFHIFTFILKLSFYTPRKQSCGGI